MTTQSHVGMKRLAVAFIGTTASFHRGIGSAQQIIPPGQFALQTRHGAALLTRIVDRIFYLALTALVLGVGGYLLIKLYKPKVEGNTFPIELAENSLKALYARDAAALYGMLPESAKAIFPSVTSIEAQAKRETLQIPDPPRFRTLRTSEVLGTGGVAIFKAEFDEGSVWHEQVSVARVGGV